MDPAFLDPHTRPRLFRRPRLRVLLDSLAGLAVVVFLPLLLLAVLALAVLASHPGEHLHSSLPFACEPSSTQAVSNVEPGQSGLYATAIDGIYRYRVQDGRLTLIWHFLLKSAA